MARWSVLRVDRAGRHPSRLPVFFTRSSASVVKTASDGQPAWSCARFRCILNPHRCPTNLNGDLNRDSRGKKDADVQLGVQRLSPRNSNDSLNKNNTKQK